MKHLYSPFLISALLFLAIFMLNGCAKYEKPQFLSVDDYPTQKADINEMHYRPDFTKFSLWSPNADSVRVNLYETAEGGTPYRTFHLTPKKDGSWKGRVTGNLLGSYYTFQIFEDSTWHAETPGIFAKAVSINGQRGAIVDLKATNPEGWKRDKRPALAQLNDAVIYEMHWRDFSAAPSAGSHYPGKYLALTESNTQSPEGLATGIDHLKELGVTHIHIMPSYDFGSIDERGTTSEAVVLESGAAAGGNYNWGYDPVNYNVPEGSYSTDPANPSARIKEFKQMVKACHEAGIRVIMDVVYNHTYNVASSNFTLTAPGYFYRTDSTGTLGNASGCGNETASERPMMRKFMIESCRYWLKEYHIDGFRFDLMGVHDIETMNAIRKMADKIDPSILIYGEGWAAGSPLLADSLLATKANVLQLDRIAAFSDDMRDALRGPFSDDHKGAFLAEQPGNEMSIRFGIVGSISHPDVEMSQVNYSKQAWAKQPYQTIAYVSCHDDMCLVDRLHASAGAADEEEIARLDMLAQTAVLTSQGIPFIFCGEEVMRDKKGVHNSFCSPDSINVIDWTRKALHNNVFQYYANLISLRKAHPAFHLGDAKLVREAVRFLPLEVSNVIAFTIDGAVVNDERFVVILNARRDSTTIPVPEGKYNIYVNNQEANPTGLSTWQGTEISVAPQTALIMAKN